MEKKGASVTEEDVLHEIRVKLYPNTLPTVKGKYIARTYNRKNLSIEHVCKTLKRRSSYEGDYNNTVKAVKAYFDEMMYQLCDGHSVSNGYFTVFPNVGGTFNSQKDSYDREKNPIDYRIRPLTRMIRATEHTHVEIEGLAEVNGFIDEFFDGHTKSVNDHISGNDVFSITGGKIKVVDDGVNTECGVFFVKTDDPSVRLKVQSYLIENTATKINGVTPMLLAPASYRIEIVTQYTGSNTTVLKKPRTIVSDFALIIE